MWNHGFCTSDGSKLSKYRKNFQITMNAVELEIWFYNPFTVRV